MGERLDIRIFDRMNAKDEAHRAKKIENIYHAGQEKIWNGTELLSELKAKHGGIHISDHQRRAVLHVFSGLMWGELAAWKASAQLTDRLDCFEAKMAATSQTHDEARHFYVLHDYLSELSPEIPPPDRSTRALLDTVLGTDRLLEKLVGMNLYVESIALTLFKLARAQDLCPVLSELLLFYERDEARHVGLGIQYAPELVRKMTAYERARIDAFQLKILMCSLGTLRFMQNHLRALGIDPREVADAGRARMLETRKLLSDVSGRFFTEVAGPTVMRLFDTAVELSFPTEPDRRLVGAGRALLLGQPQS